MFCPDERISMEETTTIPPQETELKEPITLEILASKVDMLGEQLNWLCENLAGVFGLVQQMGANGGGIRGMMKAMKDAPEMAAQIGESSE
jgi:hypothetical protein